MKLPIIPFEVAKDLKKLGFDWQVSQFYYRTTQIYTDNCLLANYNSEDKLDIHIKTCSAPNQSEVVMWFREVYDLEVWTIPDFNYNYENLEYKTIVTLLKNRHILQAKGYDTIQSNKSYNQSQLDGIKTAIKYLKNESNDI